MGTETFQKILRRCWKVKVDPIWLIFDFQGRSREDFSTDFVGGMHLQYLNKKFLKDFVPMLEGQR